jgi:predicted dehydrogenase
MKTTRRAEKTSGRSVRAVATRGGDTTPTDRSGTLGVGIVGIGWVAIQHLQAFQKNPRARVVALCGRDEGRARARLESAGIDAHDARFTIRYQDLLASPDIDIISIATPNHLHARQAVAAAAAGKHILLEKPTGLDPGELRQIRDAVRKAGVRTIVSFELHYNPYLRFARWLREAGWLGRLRFARFQYLSRVTDWYSGWSWVRTRQSGRSHLLAAGCHAVDALRWCTGLEPVEVAAYDTKFTAGYQWPTSIVVNLRLDRRRSPVLGQVVSSTDFQMPYTFGVEMMGDRATLRDDLLLWNDEPIDLSALRTACPFPDVRFEETRTPTGAAAVRVLTEMPGSADVSHHPFQGEIDELVACILEDRDTHLNVFDAQKTMEICIAADRSAARGGRAVRLPLLTS